VQNRYTYDLTRNRILPWILGSEILKDHRCIWVELAISLEGTTTDSAYTTLESVWAANYNQWQSQFPKLKD
jgi:cyanosortase A-associated protein